MCIRDSTGTWSARWGKVPPRRRLLALAALAAGVVTGALTGWLVLVVVLPVMVLGLPVLLDVYKRQGLRGGRVMAGRGRSR